MELENVKAYIKKKKKKRFSYKMIDLGENEF